MSYKRVGPAELIPVGFQVMTLSNSTAVALNSTATPCTALRFSVETNSIRFRQDSTAPTLTTGVLLTAGNYFWDGVDTTNFKFQRSTGTAKVTVMSYRRPADPTS